jgi:hypothetical protein
MHVAIRDLVDPTLLASVEDLDPVARWLVEGFLHGCCRIGNRRAAPIGSTSAGPTSTRISLRREPIPNHISCTPVFLPNSLLPFTLR